MTRGRYKDTKDWIEQGEIVINPHKQKTYDTEYAQIAERLSATGASEADIAYLFGVTEKNLRRWKKENPDFKKAINKGKQLTLAYLIAKGIKAAGGYKIKDRIIEYNAQLDDDGNVIELPEGSRNVRVKEIEKTIPVNERLLMFLASALDRQLGNESWINKQYLEKKEEKTITHKIDATSVAEQIDKIAGERRKYVESHELPKELLVEDVDERQEV